MSHSRTWKVVVATSLLASCVAFVARPVAAAVPLVTVVTDGRGAGRVESPIGISCWGFFDSLHLQRCEADPVLGIVVTLTATPSNGSRFAGWTGDCAGAGPTCTFVASALVWARALFEPSLYTSLPQPVRLFDTRPGQRGALERATDEVTRFAPGEVRRYTPGDALVLPSAPVALALNIVAIDPSANGYLQVFDCNSVTAPPPAGSILNFTRGVTIASNGTVTVNRLLGPTGNVEFGLCVRSSNGADVVVDVTGFTEAGKYIDFGNQLRLIDSRPDRLGLLEEPHYAAAGGDIAAPLVAGVPARFIVLKQQGTPNFYDRFVSLTEPVAAFVMTVAVVNAHRGGYLSLYPCDAESTAPIASTVNYQAGGAIANGALVVPSAGGAICAVSSQPVDIVIDSSGYFTDGQVEPLRDPTTQATTLRLVDSRPGDLGALEQSSGSVHADISIPLPKNTVWRFGVVGYVGIPTGATALAINLAVVGPKGDGFLTAYPCSTTASSAPPSSIINYRKGVSVANGAIVALSKEGTFCVLSSQTTHLIVDATAYVPAP